MSAHGVVCEQQQSWLLLAVLHLCACAVLAGADPELWNRQSVELTRTLAKELYK